MSTEPNDLERHALAYVAELRAIANDARERARTGRHEQVARAAARLLAGVFEAPEHVNRPTAARLVDLLDLYVVARFVSLASRPRDVSARAVLEAAERVVALFPREDSAQ